MTTVFFFCFFLKRLHLEESFKSNAKPASGIFFFNHGKINTREGEFVPARWNWQLLTSSLTPDQLCNILVMDLVTGIKSVLFSYNIKTWIVKLEVHVICSHAGPPPTRTVHLHVRRRTNPRRLRVLRKSRIVQRNPVVESLANIFSHLLFSQSATVHTSVVISKVRAPHVGINADRRWRLFWRLVRRRTRRSTGRVRGDGP